MSAIIVTDMTRQDENPATASGPWPGQPVVNPRADRAPDEVEHALGDPVCVGMLRWFAVEETEKTVSVSVSYDARDEGSETLTRTLSNPSPARVRIVDSTATGTISKDD